MLSKILVVEEQPMNVQLLKRKLERKDMVVFAAHSGHEALDLIAKDKPDLILLDMMMPDIGSIEAFQQLQSAEKTRNIPVIFITERISKEEKIKSLGICGVDYITKPIDLDETLARIQTQLGFIKLNRKLVELQSRLGESRRSATIGTATQGIAHNLNNLLSVVVGYVDLIKTYHERPELVKKSVQHLGDAVMRIIAIIKQLTNLVVKNRPPIARVPLERLLKNAIARYQADFRINQPVAIENPVGNIALETNSETVEDAIAKLLINAWESYGSAPDEQRPITLRTEVLEKSEEGKYLLIQIEDSGRGIDPEIKDHAFEPFTSAKHAVGIGLTVARHTMRNLGGEVLLAERAESGALATIRHPLDSKEFRPAWLRNTRHQGRVFSPTIAFLGAGRLASNIVRGLLMQAVCTPRQIRCTSKSGGSASKLAAETGIVFEPDLPALLAPADLVIAAFTPQSLATTDARLAELTAGKLVVSLLAGKRLTRLAQAFPAARNLIRAIPNTPAAIGAGITPYCSLHDLDATCSATLEKIFGALGQFLPLPEVHFDALTALVGSGPAFLFEFVAAMRDGGIAAGLAPAEAGKLALETVLGSARLLVQAAVPPEMLHDQVVSPNGATYAGLEVLARKNFRETIKETICVAARRAEELFND